jgi:hypothetical protein
VPPKQFLCRSKAVTAHLAAEMALSVLAYNLTGVMNIVGIKPLTPRLWRAAASPDWIDTFRAGFYTTKTHKLTPENGRIQRHRGGSCPPSLDRAYPSV